MIEIKRMPATPLDLTGGESVYCINKKQMDQALTMLKSLDPSDPLAKFYTEAQKLSRNQQAALAFGLIQILNTTNPS